jgi:DNA-binding LytR/AlgR family response regulator
MGKTVLNCFLIDSNRDDRKKTVEFLKSRPEIKVHAQYASHKEIKEALAKKHVDLLISDIDYSDGNLFDLLKEVKTLPLVLITSADTDRAIQAFDDDVTDFVTKPIRANRLNQAIDKCLNVQFLKQELQNQRGDYIFVKCNLKKRKVYLNELKYVEALGDYVKLITDDDSLVVLSTMKAFEKQLPKDRFIRIHKSYIVNVARIEHFTPRYVQLENKQLPLSRNRKSALMELLSGVNSL